MGERGTEQRYSRSNMKAFSVRNKIEGDTESAILKAKINDEKKGPALTFLTVFSVLLLRALSFSNSVLLCISQPRR